MPEPRIAHARLVEGHVGRQLFWLALPMVGGVFAIMAFNLADTYFVARLGTAELAALSVTFPVVIFVSNIALGMGVGTGALVSRALGRGDQAEVRRLTTDALVLSVLAVVAFVVVGLLTMAPLFRFLGATSELLPLVRQYMTIWYVGMIFVVVPMVGNSAIRATGDTKWPSMVMICGAIINVVVDPLLIFGLWVFPRLEIRGAALATVLARATTMAVSLCILHFRERLIEWRLPPWRSMLRSWGRILFVGIPAAGTNVLNSLGLAVLLWLVAPYDAAIKAGVGAGIRIDGFIVVPVIALATSVVPFFGQNWGAGNRGRVREAARAALRFVFGWGLGCWLLAAAAAPWLAAHVSRDPAVVARLTLYLRVVGLGYGMFGVLFVVGSGLNAINRPWTAIAMNIVRIFVLWLPLGLLGRALAGYPGVLVAQAVANVLAGLVAWWCLRWRLGPPESAP